MMRPFFVRSPNGFQNAARHLPNETPQVPSYDGDVEDYVAQSVRVAQQLRRIFIATMGALAATLAWLAWGFLKQDAQLAAHSELMRREAAANLAVATLERRLTAVEQDLDRVLTSGAVEAGSLVADGSVLVEFRAEEVRAWPPGGLAYYPIRPVQADSPEAVATAGRAARYLEHRPFDRRSDDVREPVRPQNRTDCGAALKNCRPPGSTCGLRTTERQAGRQQRGTGIGSGHPHGQLALVRARVSVSGPGDFAPRASPCPAEQREPGTGGGSRGSLARVEDRKFRCWTAIAPTLGRRRRDRIVAVVAVGSSGVRDGPIVARHATSCATRDRGHSDESGRCHGPWQRQTIA